MAYKIEQFNKIKTTGSAIGEGDIYEWQPVDGVFSQFDNALKYAKTLTKDTFISGYRIYGSNNK